MRKRYWFLGIRAAAAVALLVLSSSAAWAQLGLKALPTLTLQKEQATVNPGYNGDVTVPGPIIYVAEPGPNEKRFVVMPVFIQNCLDSLPTDNIVGHPGERITSFKFDLQYNRTLLKAVGVSKRGALPTDTAILAKDFNLSWDVDPEPDYKLSTTGGASANGERISITGSSSLPLPRSPKTDPFNPRPSCEERDTTVFLYVVFEVVGDASGGTSGATSDQIILVRESIRWNDYSPANITPEMIARGFSVVQFGVAPPPIFPITYPNDYGASVVQITRRPRIDLQPSSQVGLTTPGDFTNYELLFPLQTQYGNNNRIYRTLLLLNGVAGSFLRNFTVETDQPWLRVDTNNPNNPPGVGDGGYRGERGLVVRRIGEQLYFNVVANPAMLPSPPAGYPTPGIYVGYITIRSIDAQNSSVRLRVELIVNRNPLEPTLNDQQEPQGTRGILLTFRNSAPLPDTTYLTFGTGIGATDSVDRLFGEVEAVVPPTPGSFYARFFPPSLGGFNGLVDGRGLYTTPGRRPMATNDEASIDIRAFNVDTIHSYCVNFDAGSPSNYPVVLEYDTLDFPRGAQAIFRQNVQGRDVALNMVTEGARLGGGKRAIFITDPNVRSFCIDYLLPRVTQFPEINRGWNFVSLPVDPSDTRVSTVFPNSTSGAIRFTQNQYFRVDTVRAGIGYFVKYGEIKDRTVSGVPVMQINEQGPMPIPVRLFEGWNTVGALSVPTETSAISFGSYQSTAVPSLNGEVYRYLTSRGYEQASRIIPGYGYWLKVTGDGWYHLDQVRMPKAPVSGQVVKPYHTLNNLTISDNEQHTNSQLWFGFGSIEESRYEMPPVPGDQFFDVRFNNNGFVSSSVDAQAEHVVNLSGVSYPVVLSVEKLDADYVVTDAQTGAYIGELKAGQAGSVRVLDPLTKSVKLTRLSNPTLDLSAAYPNPATDRLSFNFSVPSECYVTIGLYNALGEKVADLYNGQAVSRESVEFSTKGLSAGVYLYKMTTSNGETQVRHVVVAQ